MSWLDPFILFVKNGLQLPARRRVSLGAGLTATDDPDNDQLVIDSAGSGGGILSGDVRGAPDDNRLAVIRGSEDESNVQIASQEWDIVGSSLWITVQNETGTKTLISLAGAVPNGFALGHPEFVINFSGGLRWSPRTIAADGGEHPLDAQHMLVFVTTSSANSVTLPAPASGRMFLLINTGANICTVKRNGAESINGVAGNYSQAAGARTWVMCDGTNWFTLSGVA